MNSANAAARKTARPIRAADRTAAATGVDLEPHGRYAVVGNDTQADTRTANETLSQRFAEPFSTDDEALAEQILARENSSEPLDAFAVVLQRRLRAILAVSTAPVVLRPACGERIDALLSSQ